MKTITFKRPFKTNGGYAFIVPIGDTEITGDSPEFPKASLASLFENGELLGPAHALHYMIRDSGKGAFSHWGNDLIFSTSDNSDPNRNGRIYELQIPSSKEVENLKKMMVALAGADPDFCYEILRAAVNTNGSAFASYLSGYRNYMQLMDLCGIQIRDKTILEIGSGPNPGTALAFLLQGAKKVYANDRGPIHSEFSNSYARIVQFLCGLAICEKPAELTPFLAPSPKLKNSFVFHPDFYQSFPNSSADILNLPDNSVDLIVSVSVLEHVENPAQVLANSYRMLKPEGLSLHLIDLRDHANPAKPLSFLKLSKEEYAPIATENRWRASDFIREFRSTGYQLLTVLMHDCPVPIGADGNVDMMEYFMAGQSIDGFCRKEFDQITPWVTPEMRDQLHPDYQNNSLQDLSVTGLIIAGRKEQISCAE